MARRSESVTGVNSVFDRRSASNSRSHRRSIDEKRTVSRIDEQEGALVRGTEDVPRRKRRATSDGREPLVVYMLPNRIKALKIAAVELDSTASAIVGEAVTAWLLKSARRAAT
jgi:hypothetical protein